MTAGSAIRSRLALRIYVVMILAITVVVAALIFTKPRPAPPPAHEPPRLDIVVTALDRLRDDPPALRTEVARIKSEYNLDVTLYAAGGKLIISSLPQPPPPTPPQELQRLVDEGPRLRPRRSGPPPLLGPVDRYRRFGSGPGPRQIVIPLSTDGDHAIFQFFRRPPPRPDVRVDIIIVLASLALASLVLSRMIARPLQRIAAAARAFGAGDLSARSRLSRRDELGELSHTFDEMAERITQLLRGQRELLASVSHELRTPLSRIRVALDLAAEGDPGSAHQSLRDITEDLEELEELVNDVLAMARLDTTADAPAGGRSGIPRLRTSEVDARAVADRAAARFASTHPDRSLDWTPGSAGEPPITIEADPSLLRRVIENLLENAHKYSPAGVPIRLALTGDGASARFTVSDRGQGISAEDLPYVFEPFFRADRSRTRGTGGVGLGLPLARRIVEAHGGTIELESKLDQGTTVTFTVPRAPAAA
jgi:two-component system OmpR family sensor kinase